MSAAERRGGSIPAEAAEELELSDDERLVLDWRREQFRVLGFGPDEADLLAECADVDLGAVRSLVAAGCPLRLALRIVL